MKVKIFAAERTEILENKLNQWLEANSWVKIQRITQSSAQQTCIAIWYDEPNVPILG